MNIAASKVFGCDDLRRKILSYFPKRCNRCKKKMKENTHPSPDILAEYCFTPPFFWFYNWNDTQNHIKKEFCNLCFYTKDPDSPALREYYKF